MGSRTSTIRLGTAVVQLSGRTPTSTAMHALTLDHLSDGRHVLGLGLSGPQVVEGWYGQPFGKPLARTREYVDIIRQVLRRGGPGRPTTARTTRCRTPVTNGLGLGKPLKPIVHPLRDRPADLARQRGAEERRPHRRDRRRLAADLLRPASRTRCTTSGSTRASPDLAARRTRETFEIAANCGIVVTDDRDATLDAMKPMLAFYIGGMGAKDMNFHKNVFARMGYEKEADEIQDLFFAGERDKAIAAVPRQAVADINLVGSVEQIRDELAMWEEAGVTHLVIGASTLDQMRQTAEVVLDA